MNPDLEFNYEFHEKVDELKPNWFVWTVTRTRNSNGISHYGTIQADDNGDLIAHDTFYLEE